MPLNEDILKRFKRIVSQDRLAHAYLFAGPLESGKTKTALALAQMLNCETDGDEYFCGECGSCRKISAGNHPDIIMLKAGVGETIKIEEVRSFIQRSGLRAFEAKWKVFLIRNAERLTKEAANALLKTLEEPNARTLMILTTAVPELCLDTIKSRCQTVHFFPKSQTALTKELMSELSLRSCTGIFCGRKLVEGQRPL
jgi:DNA polymerase-3 subunit delta'